MSLVRGYFVLISFKGVLIRYEIISFKINIFFRFYLIVRGYEFVWVKF